MNLEVASAALFSKYGLDSATDSFEDLNEKISTSFSPLDSGFQLPPPDPHGILISFRPSQFDILLDQASDLTDRATKTRSDWQNLAAKDALLETELSQLLQLDAVQRAAETGPNSIFGVPAIESAAALASNQALIVGLNSAIAPLNVLWDSNFSDSAQARRIVLASEMGFISVTPPDGKVWMQDIGFGSGPTPVHVIQGSDAGQRERYEINSEGQSLVSQRQNIIAQVLAAQALTPSLQARSTFDAANVGFQMQRTQTQRDIVALKVTMRTMPGGAFNFSEQCIGLQRRFAADFGNALRRVQAMKDGLEIYYGIVTPLSDNIQAIIDNHPAPSPNAFDDLLLWLRSATDLVVSLSQAEQSYVLRISLKEAMTGPIFTESLAMGIFEFDLPADTFFANQKAVRLRGISCSVVGDGAHGAWRGIIAVPETAVYTQTNGENRILDQRNIRCSLGRIVNARSPKRSSLVSGTIFRNSSPIGNDGSKWRLEVSSVSTEGININTVDDVSLEVAVVSIVA